MAMGWILGFNEAAGFTRRKPRASVCHLRRTAACFNEAAGFTRRKLCRQPAGPPVFAQLQ